MKIFFLSFAVIIAICLYFWFTDGPHSGMGWAAGFFAAIAIGVGIYNWAKNGSPFNDSTTR